MTLQSTLLVVIAVAMGQRNILEHGVGVEEKKERAEFQNFLGERKVAGGDRKSLGNEVEIPGAGALYTSVASGARKCGNQWRTGAGQ